LALLAKLFLATKVCFIPSIPLIGENALNVGFIIPISWGVILELLAKVTKILSFTLKRKSTIKVVISNNSGVRGGHLK